MTRPVSSVRGLANHAPITFAHCPVHGRKVGRDGEGRLLGCCDACKRECAAGLRWLRAHPLVPA